MTEEENKDHRIYKIYVSAPITNGKDLMEKVEGFFYTSHTSLALYDNALPDVIEWINRNTPIGIHVVLGTAKEEYECIHNQTISERDEMNALFALVTRTFLMYHRFRHMINDKILTAVVEKHDKDPFVVLYANCAICNKPFQVDITCGMNRKWEENWTHGIKSDLGCVNCTTQSKEWTQRDLVEYYIESIGKRETLYNIEIKDITQDGLDEIYRRRLSTHKNPPAYLLMVNNGEDEFLLVRYEDTNKLEFVPHSRYYIIKASEVERRTRTFTVRLEAEDEEEAEFKFHNGDYGDELDSDYSDSDYDDLEMDDIEEECIE